MAKELRGAQRPRHTTLPLRAHAYMHILIYTHIYIHIHTQEQRWRRNLEELNALDIQLYQFARDLHLSRISHIEMSVPPSPLHSLSLARVRVRSLSLPISLLIFLSLSLPLAFAGPMPPETLSQGPRSC